MSDNLSTLEQDTETVQATTPENSTASPDSANPIDGTAMKTENTWPPLDVPTNATEDWPNSNRELLTRSY